MSMAGENERVLWLLQRYAVEAGRYSDQQGHRHGMHRTDLQALAHLMAAERGGDPLTPTALADRLTLSRPATTALLDRLEGAGHVRRAPDPGDRRRTIVGTTEQARGVGSAIFGPLASAMRTMAADYDDAELAVVTRFLADALAVTQGFEDAPPEGPPPAS